jgi:hypothetical protein
MMKNYHTSWSQEIRDHMGKLGSEDMQTAMLEGLQCACDAMQEQFLTRFAVPFREGRQWQVCRSAEGQPEAGFPYETEDRMLFDDRAGGACFWITCLSGNLGAGTFYLTGLTGSDGSWELGGVEKIEG